MELPIIDWELSKKLAGNNLEHAKEYLALVIKELKKEIPLIINYSSETELRARLHELRGVLSYSGLERLKAVAISLEKDLKNNKCLKSSLDKIEKETEIVLQNIR